jgi:hypothetical protein
MAEPWSIQALLGALKASRWVAVWSLVFTGAALITGMGTGLRSAIVAGGLGVLWFTVRLAIDETLFRRLASAPQELDQLDGALEKLGWIKPENKGRALGERIAGTLRLVRWQAGLTVAQGVLWLAVLA